MTGTPDTSVSLTLAGPEATERLGQALADVLAPGQIVLLKGDLGVGKTTLARALVRTLMGDPGLDVPSPSFALVQPYEGAGRSLLHADLYRLGGEDEILELGLFDDPEALILVEWPERAPAFSRRADLIVALDLCDGGACRQAALRSPGGRVSLAAIAAAFDTA